MNILVMLKKNSYPLSPSLCIFLSFRIFARYLLSFLIRMYYQASEYFSLLSLHIHTYGHTIQLLLASISEMYQLLSSEGWDFQCGLTSTTASDLELTK